MIIPVRCFSCGKPIGHLWEEYKKRVNQGEPPKKILDELGVRYTLRIIGFTIIVRKWRRDMR